jgi:hypothetical protein
MRAGIGCNHVESTSPGNHRFLMVLIRLRSRRQGATLSPEEVSIEDIRQTVLAHIAEYLAEPLALSREKGIRRVSEFSRTSPRYRPLVARFESAGLSVDPHVSDRDLELQLHQEFQALEREVLVEGQVVLDGADALNGPEFEERLKGYLVKAGEVKMSDLAAYVARRKIVLEILKKVIKADVGGRYAREDAIHSLLMPMRTDSNELPIDASNLWMIDERLAFHEFLASDKTIKSMPITGSESLKEPDLLALQLYDTPVLLATPRWQSEPGADDLGEHR